MSQVLGTQQHAELLQSIEQFLDIQSISPIEERNCSLCGSVLVYRQTDFWLYGSKKSWRIRLPHCPECDSAATGSGYFAA